MAALSESTVYFDSFTKVSDAEEALASREAKFKSEIEGKNKEIELLLENFQIEKLGLEKERGELRKEKDDNQNEIIELKRKNRELESDKLRAQTDVHVLESKIKELEGKLLSFQKDASVHPTRVETNAGKKRKVREDFVGSERLPETNVNSRDGSSQWKVRGIQPSQPVDETGSNSQASTRQSSRQSVKRLDEVDPILEDLRVLVKTVTSFFEAEKGIGQNNHRSENLFSVIKALGGTLSKADIIKATHLISQDPTKVTLFYSMPNDECKLIFVAQELGRF